MPTIGRLGLFESVIALPVATLGPGTTEEKFLCEGNSLISTLFVESIDAGATLKVNWWDTGAGTDYGERYDLPSHRLISGPFSGPFSDRIVVTRIHNKPVLEVIVTGGNATFGVYVTVVSAFATESASEVTQGQDVNLTSDRAGGVALYDPGTGKWFFAQGSGGIQNVNVIGGSISVSELIVAGNIPGSVSSLPYGTAADLITYTAPGMVMIPTVEASGDAAGEFRLYINGTLWGTKRSSWQSRQVEFKPGVLKLMAGDTLRLNVTNVAVDGDLASYEGMAYYGT